MTGADSFEAFVRKHQDLVFTAAVRLLGSRTEAEDVAQTVFLRAFQRFAEIRDSPAAAGWLRIVTRNVCLNHLSRYRSRWRFFSELPAAELPQDDRDRDAESEFPSPASLAETVEQADLQRHLEDALRQLPPQQRIPLVLFHLEDMSYQEVANALGVSLAKVKTDIHRGREALRKRLKSHAVLR
jgi:RNA polymerase sigma-70 factor, ECF subfamily